MKLYLAVINWGQFDETQEAEWFHFVADQYEYEDIKKKAVQHLVDNVDVEAEDVEIDSVWINEVNEIDGYEIEVTKKTEVDPKAFENFLGMNIQDELDKLTIRKVQK